MPTGHGVLVLPSTALLAAALYMVAAYASAGIMATAAVALAYIGYKVRQALRRRPRTTPPS